MSQTLNAEPDSKRGKITTESLWVHCPVCGAKTRTKAYANTALIRFPLFCPKCKHETLSDVVQLKMVPSK